MISQQPLFPNQEVPSSESTSGSAPAPVWLQRMSLFVLVAFCIYIGAIMFALPWMPRFWDQNSWLLAHPVLRAVLLKGWARGIFSGVGLLDIWVGVSEAIHYRDYRP